MGAAYSSGRPQPTQLTRPSRHAWGKIQDVEYVDSDDEQKEDDGWWVGDRRVFVDEKADWPRSCPVLHLNIHEDFPLDAQRRLVRSCYRFWLFSWWISVINFVATMATLLTSNVTNPSSMILTFVLSIIYLFSVFFLYFRPLYWALRLESTVLFIWFYFFTLVLIAFFFYMISQALGLVSVLAEPLAPGSGLPVKVNPIFPVVLFTLVVLFYFFAFVMCVYYFSAAIHWQRMTDRDKLKLYKLQKKQKWLAPWNGGDDEIADVDDDGEKPRYTYQCTLSYEKAFDNVVDDLIDIDQDLPPGYKENLSKSMKKQRRKEIRKKKTHSILTIPGRIGIYPSGRKFIFTANEAIFNNVFKITVMLVNVSAIKSKEEEWLYVVEKLNESVLDADRAEYHFVPATCSTEEGILRTLKFAFDTTQNRKQCFDNISRLWKAVKKKEQLYLAEDEKSLREIRLQAASRMRERAAQHLLTHRDWKLLVSFVWRKAYHAGEVISSKGSSFRDIMHVTEGVVEIYLETTESAELRKEEKEAVSDDVDLHALLFPTEDVRQVHINHDSILDNDTLSRSRPRLFQVTLNKRKLGFSYRKKKRKYNLEDFDAVQIDGVPKRTFPDNVAAIIHSVKPRSEADREGIRVGDELVKVGLYDIEVNNLTQKSITNLIRNHSLPMKLTFRRPPDIALEEDAAGFIVPSQLLIPEQARRTMSNFERQGMEHQGPPKVVLAPRQESFDADEEDALLSSVVAPYEGYVTSDEEEFDEEDENDQGGDLFPLNDNSSFFAPIPGNSPVAGRTNSVHSFNFSEPRPYRNSRGRLSHPSFEMEMFPPSNTSRGRGDGYSSVPQDAQSLPRDIGRSPVLASNNDVSGISNNNHHGSPRQDISALELAEAYASRTGEFAGEDDRSEDVTVEFDPATPTIDDLSRRRGGASSTILPIEMAHPIQKHPRSEPVAQQSFPLRILAKGKRFLFGKEFSYDMEEEENLRSKLQPPPDDDDTISLIIDQSKADWDDGSSVDSEGSGGLDFKGLRTFEPVGTFEKGDTIGIIPWILNQPVSVVQLQAKSDVVMHSIQVADLTKLFKRNGALALAFFKYVAAVIGERADRDEEKLCDEMVKEMAKVSTKQPGNLTRLLDSKPIRSTQKTMFQRRVKELEDLRRWFEQDFDMASDSIIIQIPCEAQIVGDISVLVGESWYGVDTSDSELYNSPKAGVLYVTHYHLCFRTSKRALDLAKLKRRPVLYGKVHLNDIYRIEREGSNGEYLTVLTDDIRLDITFQDNSSASLVADWVDALLKTGTIVQKAPHSYTLPGDLYGIVSDMEKIPPGIAEDPLNVVYTQQRDLRAEFLVLTQTLQQVLTKQDRYKLFNEGRSVTYRRGQNVLVASKFHSSATEDSRDPMHSRRTATTKQAMQQDGPNGLYLLGAGELVVQREVNGQRIQFASYKAGTVFGVERFLTGAPSAFTVKVASERAVLKFAPRERCMALLRSDLPLAARFYQYCALLQMQRLRGPILSRPMDDDDKESVATTGRGSRGCAIL